MFEQIKDTWAESAGEIIIMLVIAFILGILVKAFSGKEKETIENLESQLDSQNAEINALNNKLKRVKQENQLLKDENTELERQHIENSLRNDSPPTFPEQE